jgi:Uma2 family endonuclease
MSQIAGVGSSDREITAERGDDASLGRAADPVSPVQGGALRSSATGEPFRWTVIRGNADAPVRRTNELDTRPGLLDLDGMDAAAPIRLRRWNRREYERLSDLGVLQPGERMEQLGAETVLRERQGDQHALAIELVGDALHAALGTGWRVRVRLPVALEDDSEPEPDFSVLQGNPRDGGLPVQSRLALVIEVADSTLAFDRAEKGSLYARAGLPDYWIVNLKDRALEVYREPLPASEAPFGWRYSSVRSLGPGAVISPLAAPRARVVVAYLLP